MTTRDLYGHRLTTGQQPAASYNAGSPRCSGSTTARSESVSQAVALDPTFALGHAALALLGHEFCAPVDVEQRLRAARLHARPGHRARAQPRARRRPARPRRLRSAGRAPAGLADRRAPAQRRGADDRLRRSDHRARGGLGHRRAGSAGVRQRLVVRRAARLHAPGAGTLRRGDGPGPLVARRRAGRRARRPCPGARPLRDRRPHRRACLDGHVDRRRRAGRRQARALLVARRPARAVHG